MPLCSRQICVLMMSLSVAIVSADQTPGINKYRQILKDRRRAQQGGGNNSGGGNGGGSNGGGGNGGGGNGGNGGGGNGGGGNGGGGNGSGGGDYNIRFNKIPFIDAADADSGLFPLRSRDFPLRGGNINIMKTKTLCGSVTGLDDYEILVDVPTLITENEFMHGYPTHATSDKSSVFWDQFEEVCYIQLKRLQNGNAPASSINLPLPEIFAGFNLDMVAEAVHDEYPNTHQSNNIARMLGAGGVTIDNNVIPRRSNAQFLRGPVLLADMNTWALGLIGPHSFAAKYAVGRARPEEIAWAIYQGIIPRSDLRGRTRDAFDDVVTKLENMGGFTAAADFTAYDEGSPAHPSWPAMHSAASQTSFWMSVVLDLTPDQLCQARLVDYVVAYARTVAGVHYPDDNIDGLNLGQAVIVNLLPQHLKNEYNADIEAVSAKIIQQKYDWNTFDPSDPCPFLVTTTSPVCVDLKPGGNWGVGTFTCDTYDTPGKEYCLHTEVATACCFCGGGGEDTTPSSPMTSPMCVDLKPGGNWGAGGYTCDTYDTPGKEYCQHTEIAAACCFCPDVSL